MKSFQTFTSHLDPSRKKVLWNNNGKIEEDKDNFTPDQVDYIIQELINLAMNYDSSP